MSEAAYFANHDRRDRFPWSLYHGELHRRMAEALAALPIGARVLVVGCGLEPFVPGAPKHLVFHGADLDARAIEACRDRYPRMRERLATCPSPLALPTEGAFAEPFHAIVAKEVIEHLDAPLPWARALASRVALGGQLILTTPNYGRLSTLPWIEATVLEWIARRDGYSRRHIHPSKFDRRRLRDLDLGPTMRLEEVRRSRTGWTLLARWRRVA
jgi:2-polyprenyl-3-methyl-5-hydroxy-6-metoxy-1,4-benzoquinol methylase